MTFPSFLMVMMVAVGIPVVLYSWKQPLYLIPLFVFLSGGLFGQVNLDEEFNLKITQGFTLLIRDFVVALMLLHILRAHVKTTVAYVFRGPLVAFLLALVLNFVVKLMFFGGEFDPRITTLLRFFVSTFAVYFLITRYLTEENTMKFLHSCSLLAIVSVGVLIGNVIGLLPLSPILNPSGRLFVGEESAAIRLGLTNAHFLLFPYFLAIAPLAKGAKKLERWDTVTIIAMLLGAFFALYRMYLFIVVIGLIVALASRGGNILKRISIGVALLFILVFVVQILAESNKAGIVGAVLERFEGVEQELQTEGSSGGGRIVRNVAMIGALSEPSIAMLGTVFTFRDQEMRQIVVGDLGILATSVYFGVSGFLLVVVIFKRGISRGLLSFREPGLGGRVSAMLLFFLLAMLPSVLFMYDPLMHETTFVLWMTMLGTFDALYRSHGKRPGGSLSASQAAL